jgi:putative peptidoglycan lipid II flippase
MSLLKFASKVSVFTMLSRILGFARDTVFAMSFGAKSGFDLFLLAFRIPNMMRRIFAEGAFSQAFIPVLSEYEEKIPDDKTEFLHAVYSCLFLVTMVLSLVVCLGCEVVLRLGQAWLQGFESPERAILFLRLLQIKFQFTELLRQ